MKITRILNKILNFISKRVFVVGLIILVQILWGISMLTRLTEYSDELNIFFEFLSLLVILYIINKDDNPAYKLAWIIPILSFPLFGGILYLLFGDKRPTKKMRIQMDKAAAKISAFAVSEDNLLEKVQKEDTIAYGQMKYINDCANFPAYRNTESCYFKSGEECYRVMLQELRKAKHFIFMEYFIVEETNMWNGILEILKQKVAEGVEVRFIYDDRGCVRGPPDKYQEKLEEY